MTGHLADVRPINRQDAIFLLRYALWIAIELAGCGLVVVRH